MTLHHFKLNKNQELEHSTFKATERPKSYKVEERSLLLGYSLIIQKHNIGHYDSHWNSGLVHTSHKEGMKAMADHIMKTIAYNTKTIGELRRDNEALAKTWAKI